MEKKAADPVRTQLTLGILGFAGVLLAVLALIFAPTIQENLREKYQLSTSIPNIEISATPIYPTYGGDQLSLQVQSIDTRLNAIESTILDNPGKVLEIALLRKDIDRLQNEVDTLRAQVVANNVLTYSIAAFFLVIVVLPSIKNIWENRESKTN